MSEQLLRICDKCYPDGVDPRRDYFTKENLELKDLQTYPHDCEQTKNGEFTPHVVACLCLSQRQSLKADLACCWQDVSAMFNISQATLEARLMMLNDVNRASELVNIMANNGTTIAALCFVLMETNKAGYVSMFDTLLEPVAQQSCEGKKCRNNSGRALMVLQQK